MFVRTKTRRSWLFFALILATLHARADDQPEDGKQTTIDKTHLPRDRKSPVDTTAFVRPSGKTDWKDFFQNLHGSYEVSFMGPRIAGSGNETYNIFTPDVAPIQLSHYWQLGEQVNPNLQIGFKWSAIQNVADNVVGRTGIVRGRTFELYDLELYGNLPNLIKIPGMNVFTSVAMSLSTSDASQKIGKITQITIDQNWNLDNGNNSDWTFGLSTELQPVFYTNPFPPGFAYRKTFYASIGHLISYRVSPIVNVQSTSTLDFAHRATADSTQPAFNFNSNLDDTSRLSIYINPNVSNTWFLSLSGFFQFLVWAPTFETSIIGADLNISF